MSTPTASGVTVVLLSCRKYLGAPVRVGEGSGGAPGPGPWLWEHRQYQHHQCQQHRRRPLGLVQEERRIVMSEERRQELAAFLRSRRARITPADVGLPAGPRRRALGLRREEVAVLAGLSPTWYAYLEQGRDIHPSPDVLDSLARALRLSEDERRYLHALADGAVATPRPLVGDVAAAELVRQLVSTTEAIPYPVYGVDLYGDLIAWNRAATGYYTDFGRLPAGRRNLLRWLLEAPEARQRLVDWKDDTRDIVARWRAMIAGHGHDDRLRALVEEFKQASPEFHDWWEGHDVQLNRSRLRRFHHPQLGQQTLRLIVVRAPDFTPYLVVFHVPAGPLPDAAS